MIIALGTPRVASTVDEALDHIKRHVADAAAQGAAIVCFPEAYLPGLRGLDFPVPDFDAVEQQRALDAVADWCRARKIAVILGMEWQGSAGRQIAAVVLDANGTVMGVQTKNQLDPSEDPFYVPGHGRQLFVVAGLKFGIAICHEGFRYPEAVRWAAVRGARVVFHPHCTGSDRAGTTLTQFGAANSPYYEQAMMMRSRENTIYFASVNYALRYQESATCLIDPTGKCQAFLPYGQEGVLVQALDLNAATGLLASRFAPERYGDIEGATADCR